MKQQIEELVRQLKKENEHRSELMNNPEITQYSHTVQVHTYNNTIDVIKRLEAILKTA
jgi:hypothetical protein